MADVSQAMFLACSSFATKRPGAAASVSAAASAGALASGSGGATASVASETSASELSPSAAAATSGSGFPSLSPANSAWISALAASPASSDCSTSPSPDTKPQSMEKTARNKTATPKIAHGPRVVRLEPAWGRESAGPLPCRKSHPYHLSPHRSRMWRHKGSPKIGLVGQIPRVRAGRLS